MAEGWKQLLEDLHGALGLPARDRPGSGTQAGTAPAQVNDGQSQPLMPALSEAKDVSTEASEPASDGGASPISLTPASAQQVPPATKEEAATEMEALTPRQRFFSNIGVGVALLAALGIGWYVYFGGPRPPAPDVVATFDGGQITVEQVHEHMTRLGLDPFVHPTEEGVAGRVSPALAYESYRTTIEHMLLDELVRRWAAEQRMDRDARFTDAMQHVSEAVTLDEWIAEIHQDEMVAAVRESDIQAYFQANRESFGEAALSEVHERIRETLAHQNQAQFFEDYLARLRAKVVIVRNDELLDAPAPTEAQVQGYYQANRAQFATPQRALVDRIVAPIVGSDDQADAQARGQAEKALAALNTGKDFAEIAAEYSQEPYSAGGVIIEAGRDDPALVEQAFAMIGGGDLSPVFRAEAGYTVLRLREQQRARALSPDEARPQVIAALRTESERAWFEQNAGRTLFTISGERYTLGQFYREYQHLPSEFQALYAGPEGMRQLADSLVDRLLVLDDAYNRLLDQNNAPLLEEVRATVLRQMMHQAEVDTQVTVSEEQVRDYYDQHRELFAAPPEARIRAIQIYLGQTEVDYDRAWTRAEAAYNELVSGFGKQPADFEAVAREYDEAETDPATAALGEWVRMGDDVLQNLSAHPFHRYVLSLPVGSVSRPFAFEDSIYIVEVLERTEPAPLEFEQVEDHVRAELETQQHERLDAELATRLMREAKVTVYDRTILQMLETDQAAQSAP